MADEKKKKSGSSRYNKSPKIEPAAKKGDEVKSEGGAPKEAAKEAEKTAAEPEPHASQSTMADGPAGSEVAGDVMKGTDGIPTYHTQSAERADMNGRHRVEHADHHAKRERDHLMQATGNSTEGADDMMSRHHQEFKDLHSRHEKEMRDMHSRHTSAPMPEEGSTPTAGQ